MRQLGRKFRSIGVTKVPLGKLGWLMGIAAVVIADRGLSTTAMAGFGPRCQANGENFFKTECGHESLASGPAGTAVGASAEATASLTAAFGAFSNASGVRATALGHSAQADSTRTTAVGFESAATNTGASAFGAAAAAPNSNATAIGREARAASVGSTTLGASSFASGFNTTAVGVAARAAGNGAASLGFNARATAPQSTAIGINALATRSNQIVLGTSARSYTLPGLVSTASANAQSGPVMMVTTDANGNLATQALAASGFAAGSATDSQIGTSKIGATSRGGLAGPVTSADLDDGAVTAAKLGIANTGYVEAASANPLDNCDALIAKLAETTGPALVVLGPGRYDCGRRQVRVPAGVELRGSGSPVTTLLGTLDHKSGLEGLVRLASGSSLRDITVQHIGVGGGSSIAVSVPRAAEGVQILNAKLTSSPASFSNALLVEGGEVLVRASELRSPGDAVENSGRAALVATQLAGLEASSSGSGSYRCVGSFDGNYSELDGACN